MKIKALAPWFGGKRTMAPLIVEQLGKHTQYFEPFCGSMAVIFGKQPSQKETVNDLHGDVTNLARVVQQEDTASALYERQQKVLFAEGLLRDAREILDRPIGEVDPLDRAYWFFLASWMMRNGVAGTRRLEYQAAVRWTKNGGSPTVRFRNAVESIPAWHNRLRNVVILNRDGFDILDRFEDVKETAIYVDPPYLAGTRNGYGNHGNGSTITSGCETSWPATSGPGSSSAITTAPAFVSCMPAGPSSTAAGKSTFTRRTAAVPANWTRWKC